ncbi:type IV secretory system conjugative DNA transfer family protein [uncultured Kordia sp.]|uniref:type IV secretory system conjugative DNA transfer family protein n=1 Tax=uncultured Kordia sp. TaxID=507699 RepID=UPI002631BC84|nr:type IV secretory system conjugative DNA transfer family protein [uncultured Kordia sp.]
MIQLLLNTISDVITGGFNFLFDGIESMTQKDTSLSAKFGKESSLLSSSHGGLSVTGTKFLSVEKSKEHLLYFGPTGLGKSTVCMVPSALNIAQSKNGVDSSMIINDPSKENLKMMNFFISKGYKVYRFDPNDPEHSIYYNPLHRIRNASDITKVATLLVTKSSKETQDYWQLKSIEVISLIISFLLEHTSKVYQNIANAYYLLENLAGNEDAVSGLFAEKATERQWRQFKALIANSDNTKASIISSAIGNLSFIGNDPNLCNLTSVDTLDFSNLAKEKTVLFLNCGTAEMEYYSPLLGLFFEQLFTELFRSIPKSTDNHLFLLIDELSSIPIPSLSKVIANARKYFSILGILQSENQLYQNYGEYNAKTILNNACRVYMTGLNDECDRISKALGEYEYYTDKDKKVLRTRPLMTSNEIRTMPKDRVIVIPNGGLLPLYCKIKPYYKIGKYMRFLNTELPEEDTPVMKAQYQAQYLPLDTQQNDTEE